MKQGWEVKTLKEITTLLGDGLHGTPKYTVDGDYYFINGNNLTDGVIELKSSTKRVSIDEYNQHKKNLTDRTVLVSINGTLGNVAFYNNEKIILGKSACYFNIKEHIDKNYIKHLLSSPYFLTYAHKEATGATIKNVSLKTMREFIVPLPPLKEQQRIVALLDEAFAAIAQAKANAEQNLKNAKELFESYLQSVFENKGEGWEEKILSEITNKIGSGATPRGGNESYKLEGISLIRSMNVHDFEFRDKNLAFIDDQQAKLLNNVTIEENDVLLNITGASVARCCVIPKKYLPARVNQHVSIIRAKKDIILPYFLSVLLTSKFYKKQLLFTGEQGATRQAITKAQLEVFKVFFPSLQEQQTIVQKLDALSTETKQLEAIYQQKINDLDELKKSILQKAFAGELNTTTLEV